MQILKIQIRSAQNVGKRAMFNVPATRFFLSSAIAALQFGINAQYYGRIMPRAHACRASLPHMLMPGCGFLASYANVNRKTHQGK